MKIQTQDNLNFRGYDAIKLKGLYMQGFETKCKGIYKEMHEIAQKENLDLFFNYNNKLITKSLREYPVVTIKPLSVWGQDRKSFVQNKDGKTILWDIYEKKVKQENMGELSDYSLYASEDLPRGGNYFILYKPDGTKIMIMNKNALYECDSSLEEFKSDKDNRICELFDIKKENVTILNTLNKDLDEVIRPIGYPYILAFDRKESLKNIEKLKQKFPDSTEIHKKLQLFNHEYCDCNDDIIEDLKDNGYIPIKIGGIYSKDINFMNALAFKNDSDKITYITNSTKHTCSELEYLEELFKNDLTEKVPNIGNIYFVSGGIHNKNQCLEEYLAQKDNAKIRFDDCHNMIMYWFGMHFGGIHCMTAEIPDFDKIV